VCCNDRCFICINSFFSTEYYSLSSTISIVFIFLFNQILTVHAFSSLFVTSFYIFESTDLFDPSLVCVYLTSYDKVSNLTLTFLEMCRWQGLHWTVALFTCDAVLTVVSSAWSCRDASFLVKYPSCYATQNEKKEKKNGKQNRKRVFKKKKKEPKRASVGTWKPGGI